MLQLKTIVPLLFLLISSAVPSFGFSVEDGARLFSIDKNIGVAYDYLSQLKIVSFTPSGRFVREYSFALPDQDFVSLIGVSEDGRFWFASRVHNSNYQTIATKLMVFDAAGKKILAHELQGQWDVRLDRTKIYLASSNLSLKSLEVSDFTISLLDIRKKELKPVISIPKGARFVSDWTVAADGFYILAQERDNTYLESYTSRGRNIWREPVLDRPIETIQLKIAHVDKAGNVALISHFGRRESFLIAVSSKGRAQPPRNMPGLSGFAEFGGEFYAILGFDLTRLSKGFEPLESWSYNAPSYGESWEEKWSREKKASAVTNSSSVDDLILALVYGRDKVTVTAADLLEQHGPDILPVVLKKSLEFPESNLMSFFVRLSEKYKELADSLVAQEFEAISYEKKMLLISYFTYFMHTRDSSVPESVKSFLIEMRSRDEEDREFAEQAMMTLGMGEELVEDLVMRLRKSDLTEQERLMIHWQFAADPKLALKALEPVLFDETDPLRVEARTILLMALLGDWYEQDEQESPEILSHFRQWASDPDRFVSDFATVGLATKGEPGYLRQAIAASKADDQLAGLFLENLERVMTRALQEADEAAEEILSLAVERLTAAQKEEYQESMRSLPGISVSLDMPRMRKALLRATFDTALSEETRFWLSYSLKPQLSYMSKPEVLQILRSSTLESAGSDRVFYTFLSELGERFSTEREVTEVLRARLIYELSRADSDSYSSILKGFKGLVQKEDIPMLLPFLEMEIVACGGTLVTQALELLSELDNAIDFQDAVQPFLYRPEYAISAAKALSSTQQPDVLDILVRAVESSEDHSVEARFFRPFGAHAENSLLLLLYSANPVASNRATLILSDLKSTEARFWISQQVRDSIHEGRFPEGAALGALIDFNEDPWKEAISILPQDEPACDQIRNQMASFPARLAKQTVDRLEQMILEANNPSEVSRILCVLMTQPLYEAAMPALERVRENHSSEEIRRLMPTISKMGRLYWH